MPSEGFLEIEAAKQRLAAAKKLHASAQAAENAAKKNREDSEAEVRKAQNALIAAEERWEVVDVDSAENDSQHSNKRRKFEPGDRCNPFVAVNGTASQDINVKWKAQGCFVYEVTTKDGITVRSKPTLSDDGAITSNSFGQNDLVSVDLIRPSRFTDSPSGPYLRCSDDSGWIFSKKYGVEVAKSVPVEVGIWAFFVDYRGATLRCHPYPGKRLYVGSSANLKPMQLLHCDRRVVSPHHGIASYRVQGTDGWVFEKDQDGTVLLLPEDKVKVGMFAYEVFGGDFSLCKEPSAFSEAHATLNTGDAVVCDMIRQSPYNSIDGPFLRLSDGWGWMYEKIRDSNCKMRQLPLEKGTWTLKVMNSPAGIAMRRHPVDREDAMTSITFLPGEHVECDMRAKPSGPATFYRVAGKDGWVFDRRNDDTMMQLIPSDQVSSSEGGWSIGFVRGIALAFHLTPAVADASTKVIAFKNTSNICINIFFTERNIRIDDKDGARSWQRDCSDDELRNIMQNPGRHTINDGQNVSDFSLQAEQEKICRKKLIELEKDEADNAKKKMAIMDSLKIIEVARDEAAANMEQKIESREKEISQREEQRREKEKAEQLARENEKEEQLERERKEAQRQRELAARTCSICNRVFVDIFAKNQHTQAKHNRRL